MNTLLVKIDNDFAGFGFCLRILGKTEVALLNKLLVEMDKHFVSSAEESVNLKVSLDGVFGDENQLKIIKVTVTDPEGKPKEFTGEWKIGQRISVSPGASLPGRYSVTLTTIDTLSGKDMVSDTGGFWVLPTNAQKGDGEFSFVQITDIHITTDNDRRQFVEDMRDIESLAVRPEFIVATGDLVDNGQYQPQHVFYNNAVKEFKIPLFDVIGNHDVPIENYIRYHGPDYYSYDFHGVHFIAMDCMDPFRCSEWLKNDLAAQPKGKPIIFFQHYSPDKSLLDLLSGYNTRALFYGHWHSNKTFRYGKILVASTPPLRFGGIGCSPRGFRVVNIGKDCGVRTEYRWGGVKEHLRVVSPTGEVHVGGKAVPVLVTAYDSSRNVKSVSFGVDGGVLMPMTHAGGWLWKAELDKSLPQEGAHTIKVEVTPDTGAVWKKEEKFTLSQKDNAPFSFSWFQYAGAATGMSSPHLADNKLYIGLQDDDNAENGGVTCLDGLTGKILWRHQTGESVNGSPAVGDGILCAVTVTGDVYGMDASGGKDLWHMHLGDYWSRWAYNSPVIYKDVVYCGTAPYFAAFDLKTGKELWKAHTKDGNAPMKDDWISCRSSPSVDSARVYLPINFSSGFFALDRQDGTVLWSKKEGFGGTNFSPVVDGGVVYHVADSKFYALAGEDGKELWHADMGGGDTASSLAVGDSTLVVGAPDGNVMSFDKKSGDRLWSFKTGTSIGSFSAYARGGSQVMARPVISGDKVYVGANNGVLYVLDLSSGKMVWCLDFGVPVLSSAVVHGNMLYVATCDGNVFGIAILRSK